MKKMIEVFYLKYLKDKKKWWNCFFCTSSSTKLSKLRGHFIMEGTCPFPDCRWCKRKNIFQSQTHLGLCPSMRPPHRHLIQIGLPPALWKFVLLVAAAVAVKVGTFIDPACLACWLVYVCLFSTLCLLLALTLVEVDFCEVIALNTLPSLDIYYSPKSPFELCGWILQENSNHYWAITGF